MSRTWLIVEADFPNHKREEITSAFVEPITTRFDREIETFHFQFQKHFLFRLCTDENILRDKIEPYVRARLHEIGAQVESLSINPNYDERSTFGIEGSPLGLEVLELASRTDLFKRATDGRGLELGEKFDPIYFGHLFLNAWGNDSATEAVKCYGEAVRCLVSAYGAKEDVALAVLAKHGKEISSKFNELSVVLQKGLRDEMKRRGIKALPRLLEKDDAIEIG